MAEPPDLIGDFQWGEGQSPEPADSNQGKKRVEGKFARLFTKFTKGGFTHQTLEIRLDLLVQDHQDHCGNTKPLVDPVHAIETAEQRLHQRRPCGEDQGLCHRDNCRGPDGDAERGIRTISRIGVETEQSRQQAWQRNQHRARQG